MSEPQVTLSTKPYCPYCNQAKEFFRQKGVTFKEIDITEDNQAQASVEKKTGWMTVPMIFIGDEFIGGVKELNALGVSGEFDKKIKKSG